MQRTSTAGLLLDVGLETSCGQSTVDWAVRMLENELDSPHLRMLAGQSPPYNHFALKHLRDMALSELQIQLPEPEQAVIPYACERLDAALSGKASFAEVMEELTKLCIDLDYHDDLLGFYELYFAWDDLREDTFSTHLHHATRDNLDQLMRDAAQAFLRRHAARKTT